MLVAIIVVVLTLVLFTNSQKKKIYLESLGYPIIPPGEMEHYATDMTLSFGF